MKSQRYKNVLVASIAGITVLAMGCAPPLLIPEPREAEASSIEYRSIPAANEIATVSVGENMYNEYSTKLTKTFRAKILSEAESEMDLGNTLNMPSGTSAPLKEVYGTRHKALCVDDSTRSATGRYDACLVDINNDGTFDHSMFKVRQKYFPLKSMVRYEVTDEKEIMSIEIPRFKYHVLYQGLSKGSVKISFREFINDMARPAFTQDISYDLEKNGTTTIAFKNLRINVLKATSSEISYTVIKPFN